MERIFRVLTRKKQLDPVAIADSQLARILNVYDLTALGVGSTLGVGVYVLAGQVAKDTAGPSVILSFLIAAIASVFAGLCYAEFGSRVPRAGSAYIYSYVTVGEFIAFIIGWNLILEYVIGSASVARGLSHYVDTLVNSTLENAFREIAPINISFMSQYFDFFAFGLSLLLAAALAFGLKESSKTNNVFTLLNILVILFIIVAGAIKANPENWNLPPPANSTLGNGGFFPFGVSGMIKGAATCFYGFVGFDCIATTGEEVTNPQKAIPISIMTSLLIVFLAYFGTSTVVTLMVPYYLQDEVAPIPHAFEVLGWEVAKWIVAIGAIFGLCASLFGAMFPLPRIIYAMASDGIIFKFLGWVNERFHTPLIGTLLAGLLTGLMSALFDLGQLVNMMSIGTLLAYTIVAVCVLSLRYTDNEDMGNTINSDSSIELIDPDQKVTVLNLLKQSFNFQRLHNPTKTSQFLVNLYIFIYVVLCVALGLCINYLQDDLKHARTWAIIIISIIGLFMILLVMSIGTQPNSRQEFRFKVPFVPFIPALSILVNIYLMIMLDINTWIRFSVWMAIGLPIYLISLQQCTISNSNMHAKTNSVKPTGTLRNGGQDFVHYKHDINDTTTPTHSPVLTYAVNSTLYTSVDNLSVHNALAALDDILSQEDELASKTPLERKFSLDSISNASNVHCEESIVVLVHNEDGAEHNLSSTTDDEDDDNQDIKRSDSLENRLDLTESSEPTSTESSKLNSTLLIPPPPPIQDFEKYKIPRIEFKRASQDDNALIPCKSIPTVQRALSQPAIAIYCPAPDYEPPSRRSSVVEDIDGNIKFGSEQHLKIVGSLNKLFEQRRFSSSTDIRLTKPVQYKTEKEILPSDTPSKSEIDIVVPIDNTEEPERQDDTSAEDTVYSKTDIKKKLNEIFGSDSRLKLAPVDKSVLEIDIETKNNTPPPTELSEVTQPPSSKSNDDVVVKADDDSSSKNLEKDIDSHKKLMYQTLNSIKLRKIENTNT